MIIVSISGGLGNQLQQYALYRRYVSLGVDAKLDFSWFDDAVQKKMAAKRVMELDRLLGIEYEVCTREDREHFTGGRIIRKLLQSLGINNRMYTEYSIYDPKLLNYTDKYIEGAFVCDHYYADILPELRDNLRFPLEEYRKRAELQRMAQDIERQYSISVHIRRGDYLDDVNMSIYGNICSDDYYSAALDVSLENVKEAKLYVFSDDSEYAGEYADKLIGGRPELRSYEVVTINKGSDSLFDIYLMSLCDCNITANSTFSYWGARLNAKNNAVKIRPVKHKNSQVCVPKDMLNLLRGWVLVDPEGRVYR